MTKTTVAAATTTTTTTKTTITTTKTTLVLNSGTHQCGNILLSSPKCGAAALSQAG